VRYKFVISLLTYLLVVFHRYNISLYSTEKSAVINQEYRDILYRWFPCTVFRQTRLNYRFIHRKNSLRT